MRSRSVRLSILILLVLGLALAALGFNQINIDLPGFPALERGGNGPLGLKLGLDLRGGGHLVYQADTGTRVDVVFTQGFPEAATGDSQGESSQEDVQTPEGEGSGGAAGEQSSPESASPSNTTLGEPGPVTAAQVEEALSEALPAGFSVEEREANTFRITAGTLGDDGVQGLREALEEGVGSISDFQVDRIGEPSADQMEGVLDIINRRVNRFGTEEPIIQLFGDDRVIVQLPGATGSLVRVVFQDDVSADTGVDDVGAALVRLGVQNYNVVQQSAREFQIRSDTLSQSDREGLRRSLETQFGALQSFGVTSGIDEAKDLIGQTAQLEFKERTCTDISCLTFTDADIGLTGDDLSGADVSADPSGVGWAVNIQFDDRGSEVFGDLTRRLFQRQDTGRIAIFLDDDAIIAPVARAWIRDGRSQITGNFTREEARTLAIQLESGRLPVPLKLIQERDVEALLGSESLRRSLLAGLVGLGIVMVFMISYYRVAGVVASLALAFYAVVVLALFKLIPITLTLSHIGGFILSIGMAVDANILIFERMKEEMRIGRTLASSMEVGFNRAWPAIRDSNVSTMITCLVLLWFGDRLGGGLVTGFAISLFIGVAASMFTAVVVSRNLLQLTAWLGLARRISLFTPEKIRRTAPAAGAGS